MMFVQVLRAHRALDTNNWNGIGSKIREESSIIIVIIFPFPKCDLQKKIISKSITVIKKILFYVYHDSKKERNR